MLKYGGISTRYSSILNNIAYLMVLFPCLFAAVYETYISGNTRQLAFWGFTMSVVLFGVQRNGIVQQSRKNLAWLLMWLFIWCISLVRNGDVARGNYLYTIQLVMIVISAELLIGGRQITDKQFINIMKFYLIIQLISGYYFLTVPHQLSAMGSSVFHLSGIWLTKFNIAINSGCFMGIVTHYSTSGMYMATGVVLYLAIVLTQKNKTGKYGIINLVFLVMFFVALVLTQKRAHLLFSGVTGLAMYFVGYVRGDLIKRIRQISSIIFLGVIMLLTLMRLPIFSETVIRFVIGNTMDGFFTGRISTLWMPALKAFASSPIIGIGWRQFKWLYPQYQVGLGSVNNDVHNIYLQLLCENGILGGGAIIAIIIYMYVLTWRNLLKMKKQVDQVGYLPLMFSFGFQTFFIMYGLSGNPLFDAQCLFPYVLCTALTFRYSVIRSRRTQRALR